MLRGKKLAKHKDMSLNDDILIYDKPKYVYIPLVVYNNITCEMTVKEGNYVYVGDTVGRRNDNLKLPILSSVSGKVIGIEKKYYSNGKEVDCIVIENDFKNKSLKKELPTDITNYKKSEFISLLNTMGIVGMSGSGFPTYIKYNTTKKINTLVINGIECEPYLTCDYTIIKYKIKEIVECINAIIKIMKIGNSYICIKKGHPELKKIILDEIFNYKNIYLKEIKDYYPVGWERALVQKALNIKYERYPIEKGIIVNNVSTIYAIYEALRYKKPVTDRVITITGEAINKPCNILVKIGTDISEVIEFLNGYKKEHNLKLIAGGPMTGFAIKNEHLIVTANLTGIVIKEDDSDSHDGQCIRCGKCTDICPVKICPVLVKDNINNINRLKELKPERCIECGLCSYICPAKIELREYVKKGKSKVGE